MNDNYKKSLEEKNKLMNEKIQKKKEEEINNNIKKVFTYIIIIAIVIVIGNIILDSSAENNIDKDNIVLNLEKIDLNKEKEVVISEGEKKVIDKESFPKKVDEKEINYTSSNSDIVIVDKEGIIEGVSSGNADINIKSEDKSYKETINIIVKIFTEKVIISHSSLKLNVNEISKLNYDIIPFNAEDKSVTWESENPNVATVDSQGNIKAVSGGKTNIIVKTNDSKVMDKCEVTVVENTDYIIPNSSKVLYKGNIVTSREYAIMQSWAVDNNNLYISQGSSGETGYITATNNNVTIGLPKFGHMDIIDIENTNGKSYIWSQCGLNVNGEHTKNCRIELCNNNCNNNSLNFNNVKYTAATNENGTLGQVYDINASIAVDSNNRTLVLSPGSNRTLREYIVYNLDDFIANGTNAKVISKFSINNKTLSINDGRWNADNYLRSWQGMDVYNNYIYILEGNPKNNELNGTFVTVVSLTGEVKRYRTKIEYPDNNINWEPEGIKVYNNLMKNSGESIYIGFSTADKIPKTHYIYRLEK